MGNKVTKARTLTEHEESVLEDYVRWLRSWTDSESTIRARRIIARARIREWTLDGFTYDNVIDYLSQHKRWTRSTYHAHLLCFCGWAATAGHIEADPMGEVRKPKRPSSKPRPLSEAEVTAVLAVAKGFTRDWIVVALHSGLRVSEIAALRGEDVTADGIYLRGKGDKPEILPCHPEIWNLAQRYPRRGYWWPGDESGNTHITPGAISSRVGRLFRDQGIRDGSIHRCRHVFGTRLLRSGANIRTVQKLMRHSNLDTTANYTAVDEDEMRDAINLLPPSA